MSQRFYVYPLIFVALTQLVPLLRGERRWYGAQIAQLALVLIAALGACYFEDELVWAVIAWCLFLILVIAPRLLLRRAMRIMSARSLGDAAPCWQWAGRLAWGEIGRLYRAHAAVLKLWDAGNRLAAEALLDQLSARSLPETWRGEVAAWRLTLRAINRDWQQVIAFYESVDSWGSLASATQARLIAARAYAELGDFERALRCLEFVALSPRTVGAVEMQLLMTRVSIAALAGDEAELNSLLQREEEFPRRGFARFTAYWRGRCELVRGNRADAGQHFSRALALTNSREKLWRERIDEQLQRVNEESAAASIGQPTDYFRGQEVLRFAEQQSTAWRALMHIGRPQGATLMLLFAFALVFLIDVVVFDAILHEPLWLWAGNVPEAVRHGEWWRLATALFLHANPLHLLMNSATLWLFGAAVERAFGRWRLLTIFIIAGVLGNVCSVWRAQYDVSVGASGGIFGIIGAFAVAAYQLKSPIFASVRRRLLVLMTLVVASDLTIGWLEPQIDNLAHAGGFIAGLLLALLLAPRCVQADVPVVDAPRAV